MTLHWERLCVCWFVCVEAQTAPVFVVTKGLQGFEDSKDTDSWMLTQPNSELGRNRSFRF